MTLYELARRFPMLLTDSRALSNAEKTLFFALSTNTGDGHRYIPDLYKRGVRAFVVKQEISLPDDATQLVVHNPLEALQELAREHRMEFNNLPVVAITGSRGKTVVKEMLAMLLRDHMAIVKSPRSFNSQIGVPLSVWQLSGSTDLAIFEAGISRPDEMSKLNEIIKPTIGILTNIWEDHSEGFESEADKIKEKFKLFEGCQVVFVPDNDPRIGDEIAKLKNTTRIVYYPGNVDPLCHNRAICRAVGQYLGLSATELEHRIESLMPIETRIDVIEAFNDCQLIVDRFTNDIGSIDTALDFVDRMLTADHSVTMILGDMVDSAYEEAIRIAVRRGVNKIIGIGADVKAHSDIISDSIEVYESVEDFLKQKSPRDFSNEVILLKAMSDCGFAHIVEKFETRQHETILEVNLDALMRNFKTFKSFVKPQTGIVAMVKAFGYGAGSTELAKALQGGGASYLAVAAHDEGVELRKAGIVLPIMVLNPKVSNYSALFDYQLEPEVYSFEVLKEISEEAARRGVTDYPVHIKIDTGMHRLGFLLEELPMLVRLLENQNRLRVKSVFSHLCCADDPMEDDYTFSQFDYFDRCCDILRQGLSHSFLRHILNTAGIVRFPEHQYDMVRLGIGLYGLTNLPSDLQPKIERVATLKTVIISIREWPDGTTVGYNRRGMLKRPSRIATIPIGYADGIDRHLGNGKLSVVVNGHSCPTVGNVCMDVMMIDVTDVDCRQGDSVELFGNAAPTEIMAQNLDTIPYEVQTSVAARVKRVYFRE